MKKEKEITVEDNEGKIKSIMDKDFPLYITTTVKKGKMRTERMYYLGNSRKIGCLKMQLISIIKKNRE